ncbi:MAG: exodeoxyribonuclease VII small subunit [Bacillota bacterium]|nr:exodeoxyribonuclease VII small subunit [Bacillota bacterium]
MEEKQYKFHEAMKRLDEIVSKLNSPELELEEAMELFVEGSKLSLQCENQLKEFENKVLELTQDGE